MRFGNARNLVKTTVIVLKVWCDCEVIENLPNINDGEDEDEEAVSLHLEKLLLLVQSRLFIDSLT